MHTAMTRPRRPRPSAPQDGFTLVEILVAAALTLIVLIAASDLIASTMARSAKIQQQEQARMVANQIGERARAVGCGMVYGSEPSTELTGAGAACQRVLGGLQGTPPPGCAAPSASVYGDVTFCWADGNRTYDITIATGWDYSKEQAPSNGPGQVASEDNNPDTFVRRITVDPRASGVPTVTVETREPAPTDRGVVNPRSLCTRAAGNGSVSIGTGLTIQHSIAARPVYFNQAPTVLFPKLPQAAQC